MKRKRNIKIKSFNWTDEMRAALRKKQIYLLSELIKVCEMFNLKYFLVGGSALGAVRHQGFIPWDDDIDVALPRGDYNEFVSVAQSKLPGCVFLQTHLTDRDYRNDFAKLRLDGTTFIESSCRNLNIHHGIYIDVFPIDGYPSKRRDIKKLCLKKKIAKLYIGKDYCLRNDRPAFRVLLYKCKLIVCAALCGLRDTSKVISYLDRLYQKWDYNACDEVVCHGGVWGELEHCPKSYYGKGIIAHFENMEVMIPEQFDKYLEHKYPNYMQLPPVEKRIPHHYCDIIDTDKSYKLYG